MDDWQRLLKGVLRKPEEIAQKFGLDVEEVRRIAKVFKIQITPYYAGLIKDFTGINDPYEAPEHPEIFIDTSETTVEEAVSGILRELWRRGRLDAFEPEPMRGSLGWRRGGVGMVGPHD